VPERAFDLKKSFDSFEEILVIYCELDTLGYFSHSKEGLNWIYDPDSQLSNLRQTKAVQGFGYS